LQEGRVTHKKILGCSHWYQVNAIPQVNDTVSPEKTKKPGHRPEEGKTACGKKRRNINRLTEPVAFSKEIQSVRF
jgi:hypothetical protein